MSALINEKSLSLSSPVIGCRFHMLSMHVHPGQIQSSTIPSVLISPSSLSSLLQLKWEKEPGWRSHSRLWKYHLRASPLLPPHSSCSFHKFKLEICFLFFLKGLVKYCFRYLFHIQTLKENRANRRNSCVTNRFMTQSFVRHNSISSFPAVEFV